MAEGNNGGGLGSVLDAFGDLVVQLWDAIGEIPSPFHGWSVAFLVVVVLWLVFEAWWFGHGTTTCGARLRGKSRQHNGWHCRRAVRVGSTTCGIQGHGRGWIGENILGVLSLLFILGHLVGIY